METVCEECGLTKADWKANNGKGFEHGKVGFCCQGCFLGIGCTCKETGVRRVVVVGGPPVAVSVKKAGRRVKVWESKVAEIEKRSKGRAARTDGAFRRETAELRRRIEASRQAKTPVGSGEKATAK